MLCGDPSQLMDRKNNFYFIYFIFMNQWRPWKKNDPSVGGLLYDNRSYYTNINPFFS